ncbi:EF-hand domain-containing protein [Undibacterium sp. TJN19]|uniref:EF-hand domain-containing protein n=1 Tax=Undibacterium sp. TJN19 TaxID=3413055 RepID=UPI003BF0C6E3
MSGINSIGSSSSYSYTGNVQRQGRDQSKIADSVFSKLDTKNQGYLEVSDLEAAFSNIGSSASSSTTGTSNATNTGSTTGTTATGSASGNSASIDDLFKKLDSDGDGKITKDEFSAGIKNLSSALDNQFHARRAGGGHRPPPPQDGGGGDSGGLDKTQLGDLATTVGKSNSAAGAALTQVAQNFDAADTNQDGKVSFAETLAYLEKTVTNTQTAASTASGSTSTASSASTTATNSIASLTSPTSATTSATANSSSSSNSDSGSNSNSSTDAALFKKTLQLLRAYSAPPEASNGQGISVSA